MGICESTNKNDDNKSNKNVKKMQIKSKPSANENYKLIEDDNSNNKETHPSTQNDQDINNNKCPELYKYDIYQKSELSRCNNNISVFSSGLTEQEVIVHGEINKNCKNKEEDFDNCSFKKLVKNNGGIVIKNREKNRKISYDGPLIDKNSMLTLPLKTKTGENYRNTRSENNKSLINDKIKQVLEDKNNNYTNSNSLRLSNKIDVSMNDNMCTYLSVPKIDEPLPDIDELSNESNIL
jgi:hypothetical protein